MTLNDWINGLVNVLKFIAIVGIPYIILKIWVKNKMGNPPIIVNLNNLSRHYRSYDDNKYLGGLK